MSTVNFPNFLGPIQDFGQDFLNNFEVEWGIYDQDGNSLTGLGLSLIGAIQSTHAFKYDKITRVSDFPVERGGFATYNKVELPALSTVVLNLTGSDSDRTQFLNQIDIACKSTKLYTIITPEIQYLNYSIQSYNYSRTAQKGATLLSVELMLMEVRQVTERFDNQNGKINGGKNPADSPSQKGGKVQPKTPSSQTANAAGGA